jgi:sulfonate transport system substrate-binding protein
MIRIVPLLSSIILALAMTGIARADDQITIRFGFANVGVDNRQFSGGNAIATAHAEHYVENELKDLPNVKLEWLFFRFPG